MQMTDGEKGHPAPSLTTLVIVFVLVSFFFFVFVLVIVIVFVHDDEHSDLPQLVSVTDDEKESDPPPVL